MTTTKEPDKFSDLIHERIKVEKLINEEIARGLREMQNIENIIEGLDEKEKLLMRYRYIKGLKWETICYKMDYSWRHIHNIHSRILRELNKVE